MAIFTYESPRSPSKAAGKVIVADTSYLECLADPTDSRYSTISAFHQDAINQGALFGINVIVRQEFMKLSRTASLQIVRSMTLHLINQLFSSLCAPAGRMSCG